jgi:hypothetical protein
VFLSLTSHHPAGEADPATATPGAR